MKVYLLLGFAFLVSPFLYGEEVTPTESTKGCVMLFCSRVSGGGITKFFLKVADSEQDDPDTGDHQIWGYNPLNKTFDRKGNLIFERVNEKDFIRRGGAGMRDGKPCIFKCPAW